MRKIFPTGVPVRGKDLIGREKEIEEILMWVKMGQSVAIVGPRRYGKTSVLLEVLDRLKRQYMVGYVDIFKVLSKMELASKIVNTVVTNKKIPHLIERLKENIAEVIRHVELKQMIEDFEFIIKFIGPKQEEDELLERSLEFPEEFARRYGANFVMTYDEFGDLAKLDGEPLIKKMRSIFQLQERVVYLFAGSQESVMINLFTGSKQAFFRFAKVIEIGPLHQEALMRYIIERFREIGIELEEGIAKAIVLKTHAHPYYTQALCQNLYILLKGEKKKAEIKDVEAAYKETVTGEHLYFDELWDGLKSRKNFLEVLRFLSTGNGNPYKIEQMERQEIYYIISRLEKLGYIRKVGKGRYELNDPLFAEYIRLQSE